MHQSKASTYTRFSTESPNFAAIDHGKRRLSHAAFECPGQLIPASVKGFARLMHTKPVKQSPTLPFTLNIAYAAPAKTGELHLQLSCSMGCHRFYHLTSIKLINTITQILLHGSQSSGFVVPAPEAAAALGVVAGKVVTVLAAVGSCGAASSRAPVQARLEHGLVATAA